MHALKLYGPRTGRQNSYGAARGPCGPREWTYDFCSKQPVNSPWTARTGPGVWCDWGISHTQPRAPYDFITVRFFAHKAEWSTRRNFTSVLFPWSHQAAGPVRLDTSAYLWFGWIFRRTPRIPRAAPVQEFSMFFISYGARMGPMRDPQGCRAAPLRTRKGIDINIIGKNPARASYLAIRGPYEPRTGCSRAVYNI